MRIIEIKNLDRKKWNDFIIENNGEFLQSWEWGDFQESMGKKIWRLAIEDERGAFLAIMFMLKYEMSLGQNYLYCPRGPVEKITNIKLQIQNSKIWELVFEKVREIAKKEKSVFLKWEPTASCFSVSNGSAFLFGNLVSRSVNIQPRDTLILDLNKSEKDLLAQMKQKTRYNIRLAEKHGVMIRISDETTFASDFEKFWALTEKTTARDKFRSHSKKYYFQMLKKIDGVFSPSKLSAKLFLAEYKEKILAANIVFFFGGRVIYLHGASGEVFRNFMAPYLLQWEQIKIARSFGFKEYDFWGIAGGTQNTECQTKNRKVKIENNKSGSWQGITRFKNGFGGREINYLQAKDFIFQPAVYEAIKIIKKIKTILVFK